MSRSASICNNARRNCRRGEERDIIGSWKRHHTCNGILEGPSFEEKAFPSPVYYRRQQRKML